MSEVTVIVPARNAEPFIGEALASLAAQTIRPAAVIVVDDASSDRTAELAARAGATVIRVRSGRPADVRNVGLAQARTPILGFLDADDRWRPKKLELQLALLDARPDLGFVGCRTHLFYDRPADRPAWWKPGWDDADASEPSLLPSAVLVRRWAFDRVGPYDASWSLGEDGDWTARAQDAGIARAVVDEVLVDRRVHARSVSVDHRDVAARHLTILRASIRRKQAAGGR